MPDEALIAAVDLLHWEKLIERRDRKGSDWCREKGVGKERELLRRSADVLPFRRVVGAEVALNRARMLASEGLGAICLDCPLNCVLARR